MESVGHTKESEAEHEVNPPLAGEGLCVDDGTINALHTVCGRLHMLTSWHIDQTRKNRASDSRLKCYVVQWRSWMIVGFQ